MKGPGSVTAQAADLTAVGCEADWGKVTNCPRGSRVGGVGVCFSVALTSTLAGDGDDHCQDECDPKHNPTSDTIVTEILSGQKKYVYYGQRLQNE